MSLRIGINPITWSNDDLPELGGDTPLETCLAEAKQAGYDGMELGNKFPRRAALLGPILERFGLALASGWYSAGLRHRSAAEEWEQAQPHVELLAAMGCRAMVLCDTADATHTNRSLPLSRRPRLAESEWQGWGRRLTEFAERLQERGIALAYHHHMGTIIQAEAEVDRMMAVTGQAVGLLLDTGHLTYAGADPVAVGRRHAGRIVHVHCKDVRAGVLRQARAEDWSFLNAVLAGIFTVPGDGMVDFAPVMALLKEAGYRGWLVVEAEQDPAKAHPLTYARMGYTHLSAAAAAAGL